MMKLQTYCLQYLFQFFNLFLRKEQSFQLKKVYLSFLSEVTRQVETLYELNSLEPEKKTHKILNHSKCEINLL